jgi:hypothetical protein
MSGIQGSGSYDPSQYLIQSGQADAAQKMGQKQLSNVDQAVSNVNFDTQNISSSKDLLQELLNAKLTGTLFEKTIDTPVDEQLKFLAKAASTDSDAKAFLDQLNQAFNAFQAHVGHLGDISQGLVDLHQNIGDEGFASLLQSGRLDHALTALSTISENPVQATPNGTALCDHVFEITNHNTSFNSEIFKGAVDSFSKPMSMTFMVKSDSGMNSMTNHFYTTMFKNFSQPEDSPVELMENTRIGTLNELGIPTGTPGTGSTAEQSFTEALENTPMGTLNELGIPTGIPGTDDTPNPFGPGTLSPEELPPGAIAGIPDEYQNLAAPSATSSAPDIVASSATATASALSNLEGGSEVEAVAPSSVFDNVDENVANSFLMATADFSFAPQSYSLSSRLTSIPDGPPNTFNGSIEDVKSFLNDEKSLGMMDSICIDVARAAISTMKVSITDQPTLDKFDHLDQMLGKAKEQIEGLQGLLSQLTVTAAGDNQVTVTGPQGWQGKLQGLENTVINGAQDSDPPGGLLAISTEVENIDTPPAAPLEEEVTTAAV